MGFSKILRLIIPAAVLVLIFIYILWRSTEYMTTVNVIGTVIVAAVIVYFIYLGHSLKKDR